MNSFQVPRHIVGHALERIISLKLTAPWHSGTRKIQVLKYNFQSGKVLIKFVENPDAKFTKFEQEHNDWLNVEWSVPIQGVLDTPFS